MNTHWVNMNVKGYEQHGQFGSDGKKNEWQPQPVSVANVPPVMNPWEGPLMLTPWCYFKVYGLAASHGDLK